MRYQIETRQLSLPFRQAVNTAHGVWTHRELLHLRVVLETGASACTEACPLPWNKESVEEDALLLRTLSGWRGEAEPWDLLPEYATSVRGALRWLFQLLSATVHTPTRQHAQVAALLPAGRRCLLELAPLLEAGFRSFKWKVGVQAPEEEWGILDDLCAGLPSGAKLRLDANGAWDRRRAERWLDRCSSLPIDFIEQPVSPDIRGAEDLLLGLATDYPVLLALDESIQGDPDVRHWLDLGWPGAFVLKPSLLEAPETLYPDLLKVKAKVVFSSALESRLGAVRALSQAFAWPGELAALGFGVWPLFANGAWDGPARCPFVTFDEVSKLAGEDLWNAGN